MQCHNLRRIGGAMLMVAVLGTSPAQAAAPTLSVVASAGAVSAAQGRGVVGDLGLSYPLGAHWGVHLVGRSGWLQPQTGCAGAAPGPGCPSQSQLALLVGPTWSVAWGERRIHASALLAHVHHTTTANWQARPLANAAGDSSGDVQHRSGGELRLGVTTTPLVHTQRWALALDLELAASALPSSSLLAWAAGLQFGLALQRRPQSEPRFEALQNPEGSGGAAQASSGRNRQNCFGCAD